MKKLFLALSFLLVTTMALASNLSSAKEQGLIGEKPDGYLGLVKENVSEEIKKLVVDVNKKRKAVYLGIAKKQKLELAEIELISGKKNFQKTEKGNMLLVDGKWIKK